MRERTRLEQALSAYRDLAREFEDNRDLAELAEEEGDEDVVAEAGAALRGLARRAAKIEVETLLSGEADGNDCFVEIHAGAGGTESQDWAEMLLRLYARWAEAHGHKVEWIEESPGEEAGIKSSVITIKGANAYGWLKTESGVHRLVRISPFDSASRRHTSFASVWVYPVVDDTIVIEIADKDCVSIPTGPRAPAVSTSTRPILRCASRISRPASWCSVRTSARNTRTAPPP